MAIAILKAEDADMYRLFEISSLAFGTEHPFWNASWPEHWTDSGRYAGAQRFKTSKNSDPTAHYLKAVDASSGGMFGMAKWTVYVNYMPDFTKRTEKKEGDPDNDAKAYQQYLATQFFAERRDAIAMSKGNIVCLDILAVDPSHQRKGIGSALVAWGTGQADELGLDAIVEGSAAVKGLYERHGFTFTKQIQIQVPPKWQHWGGQEYTWLVRQGRKKNE